MQTYENSYVMVIRRTCTLTGVFPQTTVGKHT